MPEWNLLNSICLSIDVHKDLPSNMERLHALLEPFRLLHSIGSVRIDRQSSYEDDPEDFEFEPEANAPEDGASYKADIVASMCKRRPGVIDLIKAFILARDQGHRAFNDDHYALAASHYAEARRHHSNLACSYRGYFRLTSGEFAGLTCLRAYWKMGLQIYCGLAAAFVSLGEYEHAYAYASGMVSEEIPWVPTSSVRLFWCALACEGLGGRGPARETMKKALELDDTNSTIREEYERLKHPSAGLSVPLPRFLVYDEDSWSCDKVPRRVIEVSSDGDTEEDDLGSCD